MLGTTFNINSIYGNVRLLKNKIFIMKTCNAVWLFLQKIVKNTTLCYTIQYYAKGRSKNLCTTSKPNTNTAWYRYIL